MLVDVLEGNDYKPVIVEDLENKFTKCLVAMDHDYLTGKRKTCLEIQASTLTEVEHPSPCKKRKLDLIDGNECEPLDSNFSNDSHLLISHSVLITPEDNPHGNQEKQFEADCQEQPTRKTDNEASQTVKIRNTNFVEITYEGLGQVISDECDLTNPRFRVECQNFLRQIKINYSEAIDVEERQGDNHPIPNGLNIGLEESQHQSLVKSTIAGQQLHQIALSEIYVNTKKDNHAISVC